MLSNNPQMAASIHAQAPNGAVEHQPMHSADGTRKLAALVEFAKSFATDTDIETVVGIVNQGLDLKDCLRRREEEVADLQHQIDSLKARFRDTHQDNLATYESSREKLNKELEDLRNETQALKDRVGQDEHAIKELKESEAKLQYETVRLQDASRTQREKAKTDLAKMEKLEGLLETARNDKVALQTQLQHEESSHTRAKSGLANLQQRLDKVEKEYNLLLQERQLAQSLSVALTDEDPEQLCLKFDRVWSKTVVLVNSMFSRDLAEEVLQNQAAWKGLKHMSSTKTEFQNPLPIIPSNSKAAKQMRIASIVAIIARQFDAHLLQPTYLIDSEHQLRDLLTDQAFDESRKEAAVRGLIQALLPKRQDSAASARVKDACSDIMRIVQDLLPANLRMLLKEQLEELAEEARDRWGDVLRSRTAIFPSFDADDDQEWTWNELHLNPNQSTVVVKESQSQGDGAEDEPLLVIIPRLCTCLDAKEHPLSRGVVVTQAQVMAGREEEQLYSRARLTRQGTRTRRAHNGTEGGRRQNSMGFLDQRPTS